MYHNKIQISPQVTNITSHKNLAQRTYYEGKCETVKTLPPDSKIKDDPAISNKLCNKVTISNLDLHWPFENKIIFLISDERFQFPLMGLEYNIDPINIKMVIRDSKIKTVRKNLKHTGEIYQELEWKIYPEKYW